MSEIRYIQGDATQPVGDGPKVIVHICNDIGLPPVRYEAIGEGLRQVAAFATAHQTTVHMPRIGCGLAGGTWDKIEPIIQQELTAKGIDVTVYDFN